MNSAQLLAIALRRRRFDDPVTAATLVETALTVSLLAERAAALTCRVVAAALATATVVDWIVVEGVGVVVDGDLGPNPSQCPNQFFLPLAKKSLPAPARSWASQRMASTDVSIWENLASPPQKHALSSTSAKLWRI